MTYAMSPLIVPMRPPIGRPFEPRREAEFLPHLVAAAVEYARADRRVIVVRELRGPHGVADVAVLETDDSVLADRLQINVGPLLNQLDAAIVSCLRSKQPRHLSSVAKELGWPERYLPGRMADLRRRGAVARLATGTYVRPHGLRPLGFLSVYEAKVDDWKRGLHQANTYAIWADMATLAIAYLPRDRGPALGLASALNVGLIESGVWRRKADPQRLPSSMRLWASEHVLASLLSYQPSAAA